MKKGIKDILFFSIVFVVIDQIIKAVISSKMILNQTFVITKNFFSITLVHNTGAAFSILENNTFLLAIIGITAVIGLILYIRKLEIIEDIEIFTYALLIGGIVGNLIDRIVHGYVIDYLSFKFGSYYFPIFNFADVCIVLAVIIYLIQIIKVDVWK